MIIKRIAPCISGALLSSILLAGCASSESAPTRVDGSQQIAGDPNAIICKREQETGSRMTTRVCKTAREWEQERFENQEAIRNNRRSTNVPPPQGAAGE